MIKIKIQNVSSYLKDLSLELSSLIFKSHCISCSAPASLNGHFPFCDSCWDKIKVIIKPYCLQCGYPLPEGLMTDNLSTYVCGECKVNKPHYTRVISAAYYDEPLREAIHAFKFSDQLSLRNALGKLLVQKYLYDSNFGGEDYIIPVPMHPSRENKRGFNQSRVLADLFSQYTSIPVAGDAVKRIKKTDVLYNKNKTEREAILKGAFSVEKTSIVRESKILLIDDIFTTGATVNELSKTLKKNEASEVNVLTLSRVPKYI